MKEQGEKWHGFSTRGPVLQHGLKTRATKAFSHGVSHFASFAVLFCCGLPLLWIAWQISTNPNALLELHLDKFRIWLLLRTLLFNGAVAVIATVCALPVALALGRGKGFFARALWFIVPVVLLMPSIVLAYGWKQLVRLANIELEPAGTGDILRCILTLAAWLWPVPAMVVGLALRRSDSQVQQQALLDRGLWRVMFRQLLVPIVASAAMVAVLAVQEFAVYEPTGISVVATEVRMVFETGAFSSPDNPITQPMIGNELPSLSNQGQRAAAAVATSTPLLVVIFILSAIALFGAQRLSAADQLDTGDWPAALDAPRTAVAISIALFLLTFVVPIASMVISLHRNFEIRRIWDEFSPQLIGSVQLSSLAGIAAVLVALSACVIRGNWRMGLAVTAFLIGGQLVAIALIRIYNRPSLGAVGSFAYNGPPIIVTAYLARFAWLPLAASMATWSPGWKSLRDMAALDGATPFQVAVKVVWPLAGPLLAGAAMLVMILALTEVPATVLISPQRPQPIVPMLMTWVHMLRYDAMIEGSLILVALVVALASVALICVTLARRALLPVRVVMIAMIALLMVGCGRNATPEAVWCDTGRGPDQVVYPRGISYSAKTDTFFIVDRVARIQQLDRAGHYMNEWQMPMWAQGKPVGITAGPDGEVYVPDTHYHRVMVYSADGKLLRQWGTRGTGDGQFVYPTDIAFDNAGNVYVSEYGDNDRIQVFDRNGKYLRQFGHFGEKHGEFSRPQSMVIDGQTMFITDACNHRIEVYNLDGTYLRSLGKIGSGPGEFRFPYGLDMDADGHLIVCEFGNNRVQRIDKETGKSLGIWGSAGRDPGQLAYPWGVAVDKRNRVVAVDAGNNRLQVFEF